jgi:CO dehydrogenase/acetyl-CoA synthase delta subunit
MKLVCETNVYGEMVAKVLTTANSMDQGKLVITKPGVGKPFFMFNSLPFPDRNLITADFTDAPLVTDDPVENNRLIQQMLGNPPVDNLTYTP